MKRENLDRAVPFIDSWLRYRYQHLDMPGFVVAIAHEGEIVFKQAYGHANLERKTPMTTEHMFRIASHSKTFAATSIMQLAEQKLLDIDEPVASHVKWLGEHSDPRMQQITARQIMSHSAGIIRDGLDANFWLLLNPFPDLAEFKREMLKTDLIFDNNKQLKYSNFGYTLLGCLIEAVSGLPFNEYVQDKILNPLQMKNSGPEYCDKILERLVTGYTRRDLEKIRLPITERIDTRAMSSATGFFSTAADMCKYFNAQFIGSEQLLTDESKKEMQRTQWRLKNSHENEEYGFGFEIDYVGDRKLFGHGGGFPGQRTRTFCHSDDKLIVVVLTNCIDGESRTIGKGIVSVIDHFEQSGDQSDPSTSEQLQRFEGRFMTIWSQLNIVQNGRKLIAVDPGSWFPFAKTGEIQTLGRIDERTLKIERAGGYYSEGELVHFEFDSQGAVKSVTYGGCKMLPESEYYKQIAKAKSEKSLVALPN